MDDFDQQYEAARESKRAARLKARERREEHRRVAKYEPVDQDKWQTLAWRVIKDGDLLSKEERAYFLRGRREERYREGILAHQEFRRVEELAEVETRQGARGEFKVYPRAGKLNEADQQVLQDGRSREAGQRYQKERGASIRRRLKLGYRWKDKTINGKYFLPAGVEVGLRSARSCVLKRFAQICHKAGNRKPIVRKLECNARPGYELPLPEKEVLSVRITSFDGRVEWPREFYTFQPPQKDYDQPSLIRIRDVPPGFRIGEKIMVHYEVPPFSLRSADEKDMLGAAPLASKLMALDQRYIETNRVLACCFRVDLDFVFYDWSVLRACLEHYLPFSPQIVVGHVDDQGRVHNPHLWFLLPDGCEVLWRPGDPTCRQKPMRLFSAVHEAIVGALAPIGADPGCLVNPFYGKNPLSPEWSVLILDQDWPTLTEMLAGLKKYKAEGRISFETGAESALRRQLESDLELSEAGSGSGAAFETALRWSFDLPRRAAIKGDAAYTSSTSE